jgi:hypothetical protein
LHLTLIESGTLSEEETGSKVKSASDAAAFGDLAYLQEIAEKDPTLLFQKDRTGLRRLQKNVIWNLIKKINTASVS